MKEKLINDLKDSMKNKDLIRKNTIQLIRASILQYEKDKQTEADDNKIIEIIAKEKKSRLDALSDFEKANRDDLVENTKKEIDILDTYLPKQLSDEELRIEVAKIINEADLHLKSEMGTAMRRCKEQIGTRADGKRISQYVKEYLAYREEELNKEED